jgi:DNA polymerase-1
VDFSPDSPRQLGDVLFNQLGCRPYKKLKTGPSTDSEVLQRVADEQSGPGAQVAGLILEYRQLTKLVGTYLEALKDAIHPETGRVHASFNQTGAATGRLSSSDPNLQNIPIRTEIGRRIRKAFVAPAGCVLLSADYSQIELRMLAHLSQDRRLIEAFAADEDIHRAVAAEVFGVEPEAVTGEQRSAGGDEVDRARQIIDDYKKRYPQIDRFLDRCVEQAKRQGCVETIMKRRRPIPQISSNRANVQQLGRRMAINSVVQGSAADLIKKAMVDLHRRIDVDDLPLRMLLQIHDELVFETPAEQAAEMMDLVRHEMQGAMDLSVPLKVELHHGRDWMAAK